MWRAISLPRPSTITCIWPLDPPRVVLSALSSPVALAVLADGSDHLGGEVSLRVDAALGRLHPTPGRWSRLIFAAVGRSTSCAT